MADINTTVDMVAATATHPVIIQILNQGPGIWGNVATGLITASAAIAAVMLTHRFTLRRERLALAEKHEREQHFIATELVFMLEQFAEGCAGVATDHGYVNQEQVTVPETTIPNLDYSVVSGDWRVLPAKLMYRIRELLVMEGEADRAISAVESYQPDYHEFFEERQYQYTRLGLKAIIQARRLRRFAGLPNSRLDASPWSTQSVLWKEWRLERKRRHVRAVLMARSLATFQIANQMRNDKLQDTTIRSEDGASE